MNDIASTAPDISVARTFAIRDCGKNEFWLRDCIYEDPSILGLGELQAVMREKKQASGGRLDLLLKDPDDDSMFEVELQLGPTDETHIVRTIEYWEHEKRRWPNRGHTAVLVAETINNRFVNVVHLLSQAVPIIGIQANIVEVRGNRALHFTKIIDSYEEPEIEQPVIGPEYWAQKCPWSFECAEKYKVWLNARFPEVQVKYFESYIALTCAGKARVWVTKRKAPLANIELLLDDEQLQMARDFLDEPGKSVNYRIKDSYLRITTDIQQLAINEDMHKSLIELLVPHEDAC